LYTVIIKPVRGIRGEDTFMKITKKVYIAFASLLVTVGVLVALNVISTDAQALGTTSTRRDCTDEDIIHCGALTQTELLQDYDKNDSDVQAVYAHFGIKRTDLAGTTSDIKMGTLKTNGTIVVDGKTVATNAVSTYRIRTHADAQTFVVNGKTYYKMAVNGHYYKDADVFVLFKNGQFFNAVQTSCGNVITATPKETPVQPVYSCDSLTATKLDRTRFKFTPAATAKNGAQIVSYTYDFGDDKKLTDTGTTAIHTYVKPGTYTATVTVNVKVDGVTKAITDTKCKATVKVEAVPVTPLYACTSLTAQIVKAETRTYSYTLKYTAENGATLQKVTYNFGDNNSATFEASKATKVEHSYAKEGSYRTSATLYFNVKTGTETAQKSLTCEVAINISPDMCAVPGKENLPKNSPECVVNREVCAVPGKEDLPKDSPLCVVTPPELPQTGIGTLLNGGLGLGSVVAAGYYWVSSRKSLITALLNR
jgi:hypothetical protein